MKLIELHILQSFPVTCLNRDDVGAPKSAIFGGSQRARVSSQSWKRAIRTLAKEYDPEIFAGQRTRYVIRALEERFLEKGQPENAAKALAYGTAEALGKIDSIEKGNVKTLLYFSPMELDAVVEKMLEQPYAELIPALTDPDSDDKKKKKAKEDALKKMEKLAEKPVKELGSKVKDAADIAIFGRMVADDHSLMVEGGGLFSHALSTHPAANEIDFFTAVDDNLKKGDSGAGHMGDLEFNSACYYRYVGLNLSLLEKENMAHFTKEEQEAVIRTFLRASILAVPSARKNSMFGINPPEYILGLHRTGQPLSLVNAFEEPVLNKNNKGYIQESVQKLKNQWEKMKTIYCLKAETEAEIPAKNIDEFIDCLILGGS